MLNSENPSSTLTATDANTCFNGFVKTESCSGSCKALVATSAVLTNIKGQLYFKDTNGAKNTDIPYTVQVTAYREGAPIGGSANLFAGGIFIIPNVPTLPTSSFPVTLRISDDSK